MVLDIPTPPSEYVRPFDGHMVKMETYASNVQKLCSHMGVKHEVVACAKKTIGNYCYIVMSWFGIGGVGKATYKVIYDHELAHCNEWGHK